jgi:hypothetical protein
MDADRFDALTRSLPTGSRRRAMAVALGGLAGFLGLSQPDVSGHDAREACKDKKGKKKKRCLKKAKKHNRSHQPAPECGNDGECLDKTQACQVGRCQRLCLTGACGACACLVHLEADGDRSLLCAASVNFPPLVQVCGADADCPAEEPLCLLEDRASCTGELCGQCAVSTTLCP